MKEDRDTEKELKKFRVNMGRSKVDTEYGSFKGLAIAQAYHPRRRYPPEQRINYLRQYQKPIGDAWGIR